jgi:hypothetical protein
MTRAARLTILILFGFVTCAAGQPNQFPFSESDMRARLNGTPVERDIDRTCAADGITTKDQHKAQNRAKNDFSRTSVPVRIRITDFDRLEKATLRARNCWQNNLSGCRKLELKSGLPVDRTQLVNMAKTADGQDVGEGTVVTLEAKVLGSHYSNTRFNIYNSSGPPARGSGESVNCKNSAVDWNDIHVVLAAPGVSNECLSVTAEVSPHFRPNAWRRFHNMGKNRLGEDINTQAKRVNFSQFQMVRITGPLFYDASHEPCSPGHRTSPARRSLWEIHPAYKLDVKVSGQWMSFEDWVNSQ